MPIFISCPGAGTNPEDIYADLEGTDQLLGEYNLEYNLPSSAALVVDQGIAGYSNAIGYRAAGSGVEVTAEDSYHIGSITKSFTAILALRSVDNGEISLTDTIQEVIGHLLAVPSGYQGVTLEQLLSHTGGIPNSVTKPQWSGYFSDGLNAHQQRVEMTKDIFNQHKRTESWYYSNFGFVIAGLMIETAVSEHTGTTVTYEELIRERIFDRLGLNSAGFGAPADPNSYNEPWGHYGDPPDPVNPSGIHYFPDNPVGFNSAGRVHANLPDMHKYCEMLYNDCAPLLTSSSYSEFITQRAENGYALGMFVFGSPGDSGFVFQHYGTNSMFYMSLRVYPATDSVVVTASNWGADPAATAVEALAYELMETIGKRALFHRSIDITPQSPIAQ